MTQRIFDIENKKDMEELWNIVPDKVYLITRGICDSDIRLWYDTKGGKTSADCYLCDFLKINWHDKTEITRPVNYEDMIGCVGWFGSKSIKTTLSILKSVDCTYGNPWFECKDGKHWDDFTPAKKSELKFWGE